LKKCIIELQAKRLEESDVELRVLRYFLAVAREENITNAAESLHVTQPTLSKQLMDLEVELGKKLFIRGNRKITLTEEGLFLRKRAQEIIDLVGKTESEFNKPDENISGDIYIGGGETDAMRLIAKTVNTLQREYPNIHYHLFSGNADDVTERLDKGLLDYGILIEPVDIKKYDYLRLPATDTWGLLMKKDSPLAEFDSIRSEQLWDIPLICSRQTLVSNEIAEWLKGDYEKLNVVATYNLIYNASLMVDEGVGYALCLDKLVNTSSDSGLCFRPLEPKLKAGLVIVWKKYQVFSKANEVFLQKLQEEVNEE
jgi:DNA-binding transcriptional LysR family regulator